MISSYEAELKDLVREIRLIGLELIQHNINTETAYDMILAVVNEVHGELND